MNLIKPKKLLPGATVGILAPSLGVRPEDMEIPIRTLQSMGLQVRLSRHLYSMTDGYAGSVEERAQDWNDMIADDEVDMLLFGGGEVSNQLLPYIDYGNVRRHPKIICSYSDSTTLLNAIHCRSSLVTFYGASPRTVRALTDYNRQALRNALMRTDGTYTRSGPWKTICPGACEGVLVGGYLVNYAALYGLEYYPEAPDDECLLFIEDHERFSSPAVVSKWFATLEHRKVFQKAVGLIFGHYSEAASPEIDHILRRIGEKYRIPVVRCEDFGHGTSNAVLPIGVRARLDTATDTFALLESGVRD